MGCLVIALGGNAIKKESEEGTHRQQMYNIKKMCRQILEATKQGYSIVVTHGNGPQAGNLMIQQEEGAKYVPGQPLDIVDAMTQGQIGYMLQQTLNNYAKKLGIRVSIATILTQMVVDKNDPGFQNPSKPVGSFFSQEQSVLLANEKGYLMKRVRISGDKPYRRVVPSPEPLAIVEEDIIKLLVAKHCIVIACGGGGIPVVEGCNGRFTGVEAIVDKDLAAEKLAEVVDADILLILTDVNKVKMNYGKTNESDIDEMTVNQAEEYLRQGHFMSGSMEPKIVACLRFIKHGGSRAIITSLDKALDSLDGKGGTIITR